jgi:hypothetical protein
MSAAKLKRVKAAVKAIEAFHERGRPPRSKVGPGVRKKHATVAAEAKRRRLDVEHLRQARRFFGAYAPKKLKKLCDFIEKTQGGQDEKCSIIGPTHIVRLLSAEDQREEFLGLAATGGWSVRELNAAIRTAFPPRRQGGQRGKVPAELATFLADVRCRCESWKRWRARLDAHGVNSAKHITVDLISLRVRGRMEAVRNAVQALQDAVKKELDARSPKRTAAGEQGTGPTSPDNGRKRSLVNLPK